MILAMGSAEPGKSEMEYRCAGCGMIGGEDSCAEGIEAAPLLDHRDQCAGVVRGTGANLGREHTGLVLRPFVGNREDQNGRTLTKCRKGMSLRRRKRILRQTTPEMRRTARITNTSSKDTLVVESMS